MTPFARYCLLLITLLLFTQIAAAQSPPNAQPDSGSSYLREEGSQPVEPFRVIGNVYYVGAIGISAHIAVSDEGLILLDTGTNEMFPGLLANIEKLGFKTSDIKIILSSHAHWDHVEGHARMKELTRAKIMAIGKDAEAIESGIDNSALGGTGWTPAKVDRVLKDGDRVTLGNVSMQARLTAGHSRGCTTWTTTVREGNTDYLVVFVGGTSINRGVKLLNNTRHPGIADDYARTFQTLKDIPANVFLAQHPGMYEMAEKREQTIAGAASNPFIDPINYQRFVRWEEQKFLNQLQQESAK